MPRLDRLAFFGTPEIAVPTLEALSEAGRSPRLVVTQPARPSGRGRSVVQPPVALRALDLGLPLEQPRRVRDPRFLDRIRQIAPDVVVVVAFGQIFPPALLEIPHAGCINLHASLLPRHRGAAPVQAAIDAGDRMTGVTTMLMDRGLDTGPQLLSREVEIGERETAGGLTDRLALIGSALMLETLEALERGELKPRPQDDARATYAPMLGREDGRVDWERTAEEIDRRLRAYTPWPGCFTVLRGERVKILATHVGPTSAAGEVATGTFLGLEGAGLAISCGDRSVLVLDRVQRPGRKAVSGRDLVNGLRLEPGERIS